MRLGIDVRLCRIVCLFLLTLFLSFGRGAVATAADNKVYRAVTLNYPPYMIAEDGEVTGIVVDIVREAFHRAGRELTIEVMSWRECLAHLKKGDADLTFTFFYTEDRAKYALYSQEPVLYEEMVLTVRTGSDIGYRDSLETLAGKTVGATAGYSYGPAADRIFADGLLYKQAVPSDEVLVKMLLGKRLDIALFSRHVLQYQMKSHDDWRGVEILEPPVSKVPAFVGYSRVQPGSKELRDAIDAQIWQMKVEGFVQDVIARYTTE